MDTNEILSRLNEDNKPERGLTRAALDPDGASDDPSYKWLRCREEYQCVKT